MLQDIRLNFDSEQGCFDLVLDSDAQGNRDLQDDPGLFTAVVISLFTDARAHDDDILPDDWPGQPELSKDRRGWWGDGLTADADASGPIGSRLWLLWREKDLPAVVARARQYAQEALEWLTALGYAVTVDASALRVEERHIGIDVSVAEAGQDAPGRNWHFVYDYAKAQPEVVSLGISEAA